MTVATNEVMETRAETEPTRPARRFVPRVDIYETDSHLVLQADIPGVKPENLNVNLERNVLTIRGRTEPVDVGDRTLVQAEYGSDEYFRSFTVSDTIDQENIEASLKNGVLTLRLPKSEKARVKKIPVTAK